MESAAKSLGTERDKRDNPFKIWERIPLGFNSFILFISTLIVLIFAKLILSGLYLRPEIPFTGADVALAEEKSKEIDPEPDRTELDKTRRELRQREEELNERELALKKQEEELIPLRNEIDTKIEELNDIQTRLSAYAKDLAEREQAKKDEKIAHLVALYSAMDAGKAATIMDKLSIDTIVLIFANMKGKSAGQILAMMNPEKGAHISEMLSKMK